MAILDANGKPIDTGILKEPQTSRLANLQREFAGHPTRGLTPAKLARILEQAEHGVLTAQHELFLDFEEKDAHIFAEMSKRKRAILTLDWDIVPPRNPSKQEEDDAAFLREVFLDVPEFDDVQLDALDGIGHGFACQEIAWQFSQKTWLPNKIEHRPQGWFKLDPDNQNVLRLRDYSGHGAPLQPFGWITHTHRAKSGYIARAGLHRVLAWPFIFKSFAVRDLAEFLEIYGLPVRLGKYPSGATDPEKATLLRAVTQIGHAAAGIIPQGMDLEFEEAAQGQSDPYLAMLDWAERSESKAIVGQTTSAEAKATGLGSGVANLHSEVRHDLTVSDARQLGGTLTRGLAYPILALNRGIRDPRRLPRFVYDTGEAEDIAAYAKALPELVGVGMRIKRSWAHEKLRIPQAEQNSDDVLVVANPAKTLPPALREDTPPEPTTARAALSQQASSETEDASEDEFDALGDDMASEWERVTEPLVSPIERLAKECKTLEEFRARLPEAIEQMDAAALAQMMAEGNFAARVFGRVSGT